MSEDASDYALVARPDLSWMPALRPEQTDRLLYDGACGLCHRAVKFILRHDVSGSAFLFMPLQSERLDDVLPKTHTRETLPDSLVVVTEQREVLLKSDAALYIGERMGGIWRLLSIAAQGVPRGVRDGVYDFIASVRHAFFEKPEELCPVPPQRARGLFEA